LKTQFRDRKADFKTTLLIRALEPEPLFIREAIGKYWKFRDGAWKRHYSRCYSMGPEENR
jgi:hypothetical protein